MLIRSLCAYSLCAASLVMFGLVSCVPFDLSGEDVLGYHPDPPNTPSGDPVSDGTDSSSTTPGSTTDGSAYSYTETESNDGWEQADLVDLQSDDVDSGSIVVELTGSIGAVQQDFDVYALGAVRSGRRVQADLDVQMAGVQLGLFDEQGRVIAYVDPNSPTAGPNRADVLTHEATSQLYAIVGTRGATTSERPYTVRIEIGDPDTAVSGRSQAVVFVLSGATQVRIGSRRPVDVPAFDIGRLNASFAGRNEEAIELLMEIVREDYDGLDVTFYRDDDAGAPTADCTKIYFGNTDTALLGLADNIDPYNADSTQSAIIYTDTFSLFNQLNPSLANMVQVLANVASHETGHLLGLRHTADIQDLMDVTASARQMMADQWFKIAALDSSVMPYGVQDAPAMLAWGLGNGVESRAQMKTYTMRTIVPPPTGGTDFYIPRSRLADCGCPTCTVYEHAEQ